MSVNGESRTPARSTLPNSFVCAMCRKYHSDRSPNYFTVAPCDHIFHFYGCILELIKKGESRCPFPLCNQTIALATLRRIRDVDPTIRDNNGGAAATGSVNRSAFGDTTIPPRLRLPDYEFEIILIGDIKVGKTSLINRYTRGIFDPAYEVTIGSDVSFKIIDIGDRAIKLTLWDTGGRERFNSLNQSFVRSAHGVILTYSYGEERESLTNIQHWYDYAKDGGLSGAVLTLVGNKRDLPDTVDSVKTEHGQRIARGLDLPFYETSAVDAYNVEAMFKAVVVEILQRVVRKEMKYRRRGQLTDGLRVRGANSGKGKWNDCCRPEDGRSGNCCK